MGNQLNANISSDMIAVNQDDSSYITDVLYQRIMVRLQDSKLKIITTLWYQLSALILTGKKFMTRKIKMPCQMASGNRRQLPGCDCFLSPYLMAADSHQRGIKSYIYKYFFNRYSIRLAKTQIAFSSIKREGHSPFTSASILFKASKCNRSWMMLLICMLQKFIFSYLTLIVSRHKLLWSRLACKRADQ